MAGLRMTGLISGMDTESMVQELVKASSTKVDNIRKDKQKLEWKKEAWQSLNTKIYDFFKNEVSALKTNGSYKSKKATASDETKVSVTAKSGASNGTHSVSVKQLASSAYLTGANIKLGGNSYTSISNISTSTDFADMVDESGNSLNLVGKTITIGNGNALGDLTFELGGTGDNGVADIDALNKKLSETEGFKELKASMVDGQLTFTNSSVKKNEDGVEVGTTYTIESAELGISGELGFEPIDVDGKDKSPTMTATTKLGYVKEFTSSDINNSTKLADIGIAVGTTFSIKGKDFVIDDKTTISDFTSGLSKMGVSASFDEKQGRFYINAAGTGADNDFDIASSDANALELLGLGSGATKIDAKDAIIEYNGVEYTGASNTFDLNGLTITAKSVTGTYDAATGSFTNDAPINIEVASDTTSAYDQVKNFVKKYNELIDEMNKLYDEKTTDYDPLTEEEKSQLSDTQIEKWEEKAKSGLLRRDSTISSLLSSMRSILNSSITVTNDDGSTSRYSLASLGIVTGDYSEKGKLHILGDEDDLTYSSQPNKLKQMLEEDPDVVAKVLAGTSENQGVGLKLYNSLSDSMSYKANRRSAFTVYDNLSMDDEIDDFDDEIDKWEERLQKMEDKYYDQFAAMEAAMAEMQSQQSYISSLMGM